MAKKKVVEAAADIFREAYRNAPAEVQEYFREVGRKGGKKGGKKGGSIGGKTAAARMTPEERKERARKAGIASGKLSSAARRKRAEKGKQQ
jgi:hypothetical protein